MSNATDLAFQLKFAVFLARTAQEFKLTSLQLKFVLQRFCQHKDLSEIQKKAQISNHDHLMMLEDICKKLDIDDQLSTKKEEILRENLLSRFRNSIESLELDLRIESAKPNSALEILKASFLKEEIDLLRCEVLAYESYESLLDSLMSESNLFEAIRKISVYFRDFDQDDEVSCITFLNFLNLLPQLIRRLAATSRYTEQQIIGFITEELVASLITKAMIIDLLSQDLFSVSCFITRYLILFRFSGDYTVEKLLFRAYQELTDDNKISRYTDNFIARFRLKTFSIIQEIFTSDAWMTVVSSKHLEEIKRTSSQEIAFDLKAAWTAFESSYPSELQSEQACLLIDDIKYIESYLNLSLSTQQKPEDQQELKLILERATKSGMVAFWISHIDGLIIEKLDQLYNLSQQETTNNEIQQISSGYQQNDDLDAFKASHLESLSQVSKRNPRSSFYWQSWLAACLSGLCSILLSVALVKPHHGNLSVTGSDAASAQPTNSNRGSGNQHYVNILNEEQVRLIPQTGYAYWSGDELQNHLTASGEKFNKSKMTASHPSLPFNTQVRVKNLLTNQATIVQINDRQYSRRLIGLTEAAAQKIGMIDAGVATVQIEIIDIHQ